MSPHDLEDLERRAGLGDGEAASELARMRIRAGVANAIDRAHAAWLRDDRVQTLDILLETWRETRDLTLAELIDRISDAITCAPVPGRTRAERRAAWRSIAAERRDSDLPRLLGALPSFSCRDATELLERVRSWPPDPRWTRGLTGLLAAPPTGFKGASSERFWRALTAHVIDAADSRAVLPMRAIAPLSSVFNLNVRERLVDDAARLEARLDELGAAGCTVLDDELQTSLARFGLSLDHAQAVSDDALDALYAAVYEHPDDDARRLALADALTSLDDPRGGFIRLQCKQARGEKLTRDERKRVSTTRRQASDDWLGVIAPVVQKAGRRFERGFLVAARIANDRVRDLDAIIAAPEWATLEQLDVSGWIRDDGLFANPYLRGVRDLRGATPRLLAPDLEAASTSKMPIFEQLEHLSIPHRVAGRAGIDVWRPLWVTPLAPKLESLTFEAPHDPIDWLAELEALTETRITRLVGGQRLELTRDDADSGDWSLRWHWLWQRIEPATWFANAFASPRIVSIEVVVRDDSRFAITADHLEQTRQVLTRFERASHIALPEPRDRVAPG